MITIIIEDDNGDDEIGDAEDAQSLVMQRMHDDGYHIRLR